MTPIRTPLGLHGNLEDEKYSKRIYIADTYTSGFSRENTAAVELVDKVDVETEVEEDINRSATNFVHDHKCADETTNRARDTLPRNLMLAPSRINHGVSERRIWLPSRVTKLS